MNDEEQSGATPTQPSSPTSSGDKPDAPVQPSPVLAPPDRQQRIPLLITGVPGWLGDAVVCRITAEAPKFFEISVLMEQTITPERLMSWRLDHPGLSSAIAGDICNRESVKVACAEAQGGLVLHNAGIIHPHSTADWYRVNRDGTLLLAEAARGAGVKRFVYVSSNAAQGASSSREVILTEEMPSQPLSHYGRSKREAELALLHMHVAGQFEVVILRPCMFYGPPVPPRHVEIFRRILTGRLPLVGGGHYARSLSYLEDICSGVLLALTHPRAAGEIFNICDARVYTTLEICEAMAAALEVTPRYLRVPALCSSLAYRADRMLAAYGVYSMNIHLLGEANWNVGCSSRKATELLGFTPMGDVRAGYRRAVEWCRQRQLL